MDVFIFEFLYLTTQDYNNCVHRYSDDLYRFALRFSGDGDRSRDAVQDVFVILWEHHKDLHTNGIKGYLIRTLYRLLVNIHRHDVVCRNACDILTPQQEDYEQHLDFELHDSLQMALNQLPDIQRQLLLLKDLEGYEYDEMAEITGISPLQVGVYLYRARKKMRELLSRKDV